ncbi:hypothetical protein MP228_002649 [Amoeboaphelidium protococcarum]|nr:hypothetical protein MP228_002649 [Amoeboaphelidium protococcarum]
METHQITLQQLDTNQYQILVKSKDWTVTLLRSYADFKQMHRDLKRSLMPKSTCLDSRGDDDDGGYDECNQQQIYRSIPEFPAGKRFFGFLFNQTVQLNQYLVAVLSDFSDEDCVIQFMTIDQDRGDSVMSICNNIISTQDSDNNNNYDAEFPVREQYFDSHNYYYYWLTVDSQCCLMQNASLKKFQQLSRTPPQLSNTVAASSHIADLQLLQQQQQQQQQLLAIDLVQQQQQQLYPRFDSVNRRAGKNKKMQDKSGTIMNSQSVVSMDDFELIKVLGRGCMGKVLLSKERKSGRVYAIKSISKRWVLQHGTLEVQHIKDEQHILSSLSHPFLIHLHCSFQTPDNLFLVLEYVCGGDLATQLGLHHRFSMERSRFYAAEIVEGVLELHRMGIIYRDMKPENVLLTSDGHIKLTDFGLSKLFRYHADCDADGCEQCYRTKTFCGTAEYLAPEVLLEQKYSFEVDWWSLGVFLYEMVVGVCPFWSENQAAMYHRVLYDPLEFPAEVTDQDFIDIISRLLHRVPNQRLGFGGIENELLIKEHPFFSQHLDWQLLYDKKITPPYVPQVANLMDVKWFDSQFTNMTPRISSHAYNNVQTEICQQQVDAQVANSFDYADINNAGTIQIETNTQQHTSENKNLFDGYTFISSSINQWILKANDERKSRDEFMCDEDNEDSNGYAGRRKKLRAQNTVNSAHNDLNCSEAMRSSGSGMMMESGAMSWNAGSLDSRGGWLEFQLEL